jgi:hypothetical protein
MPAGKLLAILTQAIPSGSRRHLAACSQPLAVVAVLAIGVSLFTSAAALLGEQQPAVIFHAAAEGGSLDGSGKGPSAAPLHAPSALYETELDTTLAALKHGSFGVAFDREAIDALMAEPGLAPTVDRAPMAALRATVLVDAALPPLRLDIMGFDGATRAFLAAGQALDPARAGEP